MPNLSGKTELIGLRTFARGVQVIESGTGYVHQSRRKYMGVGQSALLRNRCLRALLESAAIGDSSENAGNKLRIVLVAEAVEQLVLFAEVEVESGIERIAMFIQFGRIGEV